MALAAGSMLGYGAATGRLNWTATAHAAPQDKEEVIPFEVLLPADAVLEIGGVKMSETGSGAAFPNAAAESGRHVHLHR